MIRRVIAVLVAALAAWIGLEQPALAVPTTGAPMVAYTYDGQHHAAPVTSTATERGPPPALAVGTTYEAVDRWPYDVSAPRNGLTPSA